MWKTTLESTSKLTLELREVVAGGVDLWGFDYPSYYKDAQKAEFEKKVIDHYYFRQIGQETVGRFLHMFRAKVREIMPYYIDMYKSVEIMRGLENPFDNVDVLETFEQETTDSATGESTSNTSGTASSTGKHGSTSDSEHRFSNTPQGSIDNLDSYLTEASRDNGTTSDTSETSSETSATSEGSSTSESSGTVKHTLHRKGNQGVNTFAHDIIEFRKSIINVDEMVINELNCLFLGIF